MDLVTDNNSGSEQQAGRTGIILVHGLTGTPVEMKPLEKHLSRLGFEVENVLLEGHGSNHHDMLRSTWIGWLDSVRHAVKKVLQRNDRVIICGLSMGALIGAAVAAEETSVSGVVMLSPTLYYDGSGTNAGIQSFQIVRNVTRALIKAVPAIGNNIFWEETPPYGIRDGRIQKQITRSIQTAKAGGSNEFGVFRTYFSSLCQMWNLVDHVRTAFSRVKCPVLVVSSFDDTLASINNATETYLNLESANKALFMLTGCDHVMTLDLQRNLVQRIVERFVVTFGKISGEFQTVRSAIAPALSEAKYARGGNINMMISPEMHGLNRDEWNALYPGRHYAHLASLSDVQELHSIVVREQAKPLMSLPVFMGDYGQTAVSRSSRIWNMISRLLVSPRATVLGLGSLTSELPGIGLNQDAGEELQSKALTYMALIVDSLVKTSGADAFTNVQHKVPQLPTPAIVERAVDKKPAVLSARVLKLLSGEEKFCHRKTWQDLLSRFIQVAIPDTPAPEFEHLRQAPVARQVGLG